MKLVSSTTRIESLRAIHALQKERGASCSWLSLSSNPNNMEDEEFFQSVMLDAREMSDLAFHTLNHSSSEIWIESLTRIRNSVDYGGKTLMSPYRFVIMFNLLIGNVIDESLRNTIAREIHMLQKWDQDYVISPESSNTNNALTRSRHTSHQFLSSQDFHLDKEPPKLNRHRSQEYVRENNSSEDPTFVSRSQELSIGTVIGNHSSNYLAKSLPFIDSNIPKQTTNFRDNGLVPPENLEYFNGASRPSSPSSHPIKFIPQTNTIVNEKMSALSLALESEMNRRTEDIETEISHQHNHEKSISSIQSDVQKVKSFLSLLLSVVQLKESTGCERAMLSSLMAIGPDRNESITKLLNDLVVEEANQRMIIKKLQNVCKHMNYGEEMKSLSRGSASILLNKFLAPSKEMESVQELIKNFDLNGLQNVMPLKHFLEIITVYIDQIHAVELLLVEELSVAWIKLDINIRNSTGKSLFHGDKVDASEIYDSKHGINGSVESIATQRIGHERLENDVTKSSDHKFAAKISNKLSDDEKNDINTSFENVNALVPPVHSLQEWEIDLYEIEFRKRIGRGLGGTTYLATWNGTEVAVKVAAITDLGLEGWHTEVHSLKRLHHPNVIRLLGSIYNPSPQTYGLVLEYCNSGDLAAALQKAVPPNFFWKIADDVANGMTYLHRKNVLHRDIKPANVLLEGNVESGNFSAKLTDFGVAIMHLGDEEHTAETGTYRWMSPEVIRHESYSFMADVYSYAVVCWQLVTHEEPFQGLSQIEAAGKVALEDARPEFPSNTPELIKRLIEKCWSRQPDKRLTFPQIAVELKAIHRDLSEADKDWLRYPYGHPVYSSNPDENVSHKHSKNHVKDLNTKDAKKGFLSIFKKH